MHSIELNSISWWYWLVTAILLTWGLTGQAEAFYIAIALTAWQLVHFSLSSRSLTSFPVQVRAWYLILLIVAAAGQFNLIFAAQAIGTWAQLLVGYCAMARFVSLHPWNLNQPLTLKLVAQVILAPPGKGSIQQKIS